VPMADFQVDKLEIRELIERSMRCMDDEASCSWRGWCSRARRDSQHVRSPGSTALDGTRRTAEAARSVARAGGESTDGEWARALERMPPEIRARFRNS